MVGRWGRAAAAAAVVLVAASAGTAQADGMPPEYPDPGIQSRQSAPVEAPPAEPPPPPPPVVVPPPVLEMPVQPAAAEGFTVTFAEVVGYLSRVGYEDTKRAASLYCARYARTAVLDVRFRVDSDWYVRFKCLPPA